MNPRFPVLRGNGRALRRRLVILVLAAMAPGSALRAQLPDALVSYWTFDGHLDDVAPQGASLDEGTFVGGAGFGAGPFDQGLELNGGNHVSIATSADLDKAGEDLTVSAWFRVGEWNRAWQTLLAKGDGDEFRLARRDQSDGEIAYAGGSADIFGGDVNDGAWHHVAAVSEVGEGTWLYIDGVQVAEGAAPVLADSGLPLLVGENPAATGRGWIGGIDDVGIFDRPLTPPQVEAIHELGSDPRFGYPLGDVQRLFDAHADGAGSQVVIRGGTWIYAPADPQTSEYFLLLGTDGSGMRLSGGPTIGSFAADPAYVPDGGSATLSWAVAPGFESLVITPGIGDVTALTDSSGIGQVTVRPSGSVEYSLEAVNSAGSNVSRVTVFVGVAPSTPRLNEIVASPADDGLKDEDGEAVDWVELHNPGPASVALDGYFLTDDEGLPRKWAFPDGVTLEAGAFLVVFASAKDRADDPARLHTNFRLSSTGEYLALVRDDGAGGDEIVSRFAPAYPGQSAGLSWGVDASGVSLGYFASPTPRSANGSSAEGLVADTAFDHDRGFYDAPFDLVISTATEGALIRYTVDGSTPSADHGTLYTGPVSVMGTTMLRAVAFKPGWFPSNVDTQSYLFTADVATQFANGVPPGDWPRGSLNGQTFNYGMDPDIVPRRYPVEEMREALEAIPTMSVVTDQGHLTDARTGIYTHASAHGKAWERPTSLELIHPDGTQGFQVDCGIRIRGGFSRSGDNPKHAFRFFFRDEYGSGKLRYPLFGGEGAEEFDKVDLRTAQNYSWSFQGDGQNTFLREVLGRDLQGAMGQPYTRSRYYHLYLNGVYWGLYMTQERAEAAYAETYFGGDREAFDTVKSAGSSGGYNTEATDGNLNGDWRTLWNLARQQNASPTLERYLQMQGLDPDGTRNPALPVYLDVPNLVDYMICIAYTGNYDAPLSNFLNGASNNWFGIRDRELDDRGFSFFVHDGEHTMGAGGRWGGANDRINSREGAGQRSQFNKSNPQFLHYDLAESTGEYRLAFADRVHRYFFNDGPLTPDRVLERLEARRQTVDEVIIAEAARWGDSKRSTPFDKPNWESEVRRLQTLIKPSSPSQASRSDTVLEQIRRAGLYPDLAAPVLSRHGGSVPAGTTIQPSNERGDIWFTTDGSDPRLLGGAVNPGATFQSGSTEIVQLIDAGADWRFLDDGSDQGTSAVVEGALGYGPSNWKHPLFDDAGWAAGPAPLGYGGVGSPSVIVTNVDFGGDLTDRHITTWFRRAFEIERAGAFVELTLEILRDDGAVVYLNGRELARTNMPSGTVTFDTVASTGILGSGESEYVVIEVDPALLVEGTNTVAIELHQESPTSSDLGIDVRLHGVRLNESGGGIVINAPTLVKARSYQNGEWSALTEAFFTIGQPADAQRVVISEVHYHPTAPTAAEMAHPAVDDADDFEFVEILNVSTEVVDLGNAAFVLRQVGDHLEGIEFIFPPGTLLHPAERRIVVANGAAFRVRYPNVPDSVVAGDYRNRLDNTGEWITLVDAEGAVIAEFRYNDKAPWPEEPDGQGPSLVVTVPAAGVDYADPANWQASIADGGTPGRSETGGGFPGNPLADNDRDGILAIFEFLQGSSDDDPNSGEHPLPVTVTIEPGGALHPAIRFDVAAGTDAVSFDVERTVDGATWFAGAGEVVLHDTVVWEGGGGATVTFRSTVPLEDAATQWMRIRASVLP